MPSRQSVVARRTVRESLSKEQRLALQRLAGGAGAVRGGGGVESDEISGCWWDPILSISGYCQMYIFQKIQYLISHVL